MRTDFHKASFQDARTFAAILVLTMGLSFTVHSQNGLLGEYFNNQDFTGTMVTRVDPTVNFDWVNGSPIAGIDSDTFTVRWTGEIVPRYSQTYTFSVRSDDGERLWINGQRICNGWSARLATTDTGTIALQAGQHYVIQLEYFDQTAGALVTLSWSSPSQPLEIVPQSQLFTPAGSNRPPNNPILFVPQADNTTVDPELFAPSTDAFSDPDTGNTHRCTEWEIWTVTPSERVWFSGCTNNTNLRSVALNAGIFENSDAGCTSLKYFEQYRLRVRFKDNSGVAASEWSQWTERPFNTAQPLTTLVPAGGVWRYRDVASDLGAIWRGTNFNDSSWALGTNQIGFGDLDETTTCCLPRPVTAYFRRTLVLTNVSMFTSMIVRLLRDDGGVVYVNSNEVFRSNMPGTPGTPPAYTTLASSSVPEADEFYFFYSGSFNPSLLHAGTNVIAVEIHQSSTTSGDLSFDLELLGVLNVLPTNSPIVLAKDPPANAMLTNLTQIAVTFSRPVSGVDASDLLINGVPAFGLSGGGSNYTFGFSQPASGLINVSWAANHGIFDSGSFTNVFNAGGPGAMWSYTLDASTVLVQSNSNWRLFKGTAEASSPIDAWREILFDDANWTDSPAPFYYGDPYNGPGIPGTLLSDMQGLYSSIYLRQKFVVPNLTAVTNLLLSTQIDDGFIAWINGVEVLRSNVPPGTLPHDATAVNSVNEPQNTGAPYLLSTLLAPSAYLVEGTNVLAVHAFNQSLSGSSDFGFNARLYTFLADASIAAPRIASVSPPSGAVSHLTNITITFSEPVSGVEAGDLLVNGVPATAVTGGSSNSIYMFSFAQPAYGNVSITWAFTPGILDFDSPPKLFDGNAPGSTIPYTLINPNAPAIGSQSPLAGSTLNNLTEITVTFSKPVTNVDATDLRVNGAPATAISGSNATYIFTFAQPVFGNVSIGWAPGHGIEDLDFLPNPFDAVRPGNTWSYTLVDRTPPTIALRNPSAGALVTNFTQVTVTFSEAVVGVNASDLLINGSPAASVSGAGAIYTFQFPQPNATTVNLTWANSHGIRDLAAVPNSFDNTASGATWFYTTPDTVAPSVASISPLPFVTLRSLDRIQITFTEAVAGITTNSLLINGEAARAVVGSGAGPYTFNFLTPSNGIVDVRWSPTNNIRDLALPPNPFPGGQWTYVLDPTASFENKVVINEIMLHPITGLVNEEWIELHNVTSNVVSLAGWRFSRGVNFTFPNVSIPADGYLIVAANTNAFAAQYPGINNVIGNWTGRLANSDETIELVTALGESVDSVHYATEGDWAVRYRGRPAQLVSSIVRSGSTATFTVQGHGYNTNEHVYITGADQPEYNGRFVIIGVTVSTFNVTVMDSPVSPATGTIVCRHIVDNNASGWSWFSPADGFGSSLELVNDAMPHDVGQNWNASTALFGTPGAPNSVRSTNTAPLILDAKHFPAIPRSTDPITFSARVQDELSNGVANVTLYYRNHSTTVPGGFTTATMFDDGNHNDGLASDGLFATTLNPQISNGRVLEFYIQVNDTTAHFRTWPAAAWQTNDTFGQFANALLQVDNESSATNMPFLRVVMSGTEQFQFANIDKDSDAEMNATFVSVDGDGTKVRYNSGLRIRGAGTRTGTPKNYRIDIPTDNRWNGLSEINLNSRYIHAQLAGSVLAQKAGLAAADARVVQLRLNTQNLAPSGTPVNGSGGFGGGFGAYLLVEPINGDWAANHYPNDRDGNAYRASSGGHSADLVYSGGNVNSYLSRGFSKTSNQGDNDWSDLDNLALALSSGLSDGDYKEAVRTNINVQSWMRYFAVCTAFGYGETALCNGIGDDYALYRGENDARFSVIAHDFDTILGQGDSTTTYPTLVTASIWVMLNPPNPNANVTALPRFMTHPDFAPTYFAELKRLADTTFTSAQADPLLDQVLSGWGPNSLTITTMKSYLATRRTNILAQIPLTLTVSNTLSSSNGFPYTTSANVMLSGSANAIDTRRVRVNGNLATWSAWEARWFTTATLQPGINRVLVQSFDSNDVEFARATLDVWFDDGSVQNVSGTIASDTAWNAGGGPYQITSTLTIGAGATLTIQPGTTVYLVSGANIVVANGGRLLAEGTDAARIRFTRTPGGSTWGGITIHGAVGSPETRIAYAHIEGNGSTTAIHSSGGAVLLDHLTFGSTDRQYVSLDSSSFVVSDCVFPSATAQFELAHGGGGIKSGGRGLFLRNFFGVPMGYNDVVDFTGGNRPGPIVHFINNVFAGATDDILDLDGTDAWVEGNIFLHTHKNGSPDSASAVSGGDDSGLTSEITIIGNIFYDVDQAATAKQGNFFTLFNNTIVHQTKIGGTDTDAGVVNFADTGIPEAAGMYLEGNIIYDAEKLVRNLAVATVTFSNNLMPFAWAGAGGANATNDPALKYVPQLAETFFTSWQSAQVMRDWFSLRPGSPALGNGASGRDMGASIQNGLSISGEPLGDTPLNTATLFVGVNRSGSGIPSAGWPEGAGFTHYRWRLDGGAWSGETPINTPISLIGLATGPHFIEAVGKRDSGLYSDDGALGSDARVIASRVWVVNPSGSSLHINEILASNGGALNHNGTTPDTVELFNASPVALDISGVRLTDEPENPDKFIFPPGACIPANGYLVVYANNNDGTPGYHLGFNLQQEGDALYLFAAVANGGALMDSVNFGLQLTDYSIGRLADGIWALTQPTFGAVNRAELLGDSSRLRINEWLAIAVNAAANDFVELYNPESSPVAIGECYLSDEPLGWPNRHEIPALSFIAPFGYQRFVADGDSSETDHLNFSLNAEQGMIALYDADVAMIDCVVYGPQQPDIAQGRSPNGFGSVAFLGQPTPGAPNPLISVTPGGGALVINEVLAANSGLTELDGRTPDWIELYNGTTNTVNVGDMSLTDSALVPRRFVFAAGATLAPGAFLRVLCDNGQPASSNNTGFALSSSGGAIYLFDAVTNGGSLLSAITYGIQTADFSIGRVPDGSTNWVLNLPSPNSANIAAAVASATALKVNEWLADPPPGDDDWFEIYNPNAQPVPLGGLYLTDEAGNPTKHRIAPLSFIGAGTNAWQKFVADGNTGAGADHVGFSLKAGGELIRIFGASGALIDGVTFGQQSSGVTEGRFPDGAATIVPFPGTASPGESNWRLLASVAINEVLTHTDEPLEDAIEMRNLTAQQIDLSGWWLSDDNGTLQKFQIPNGTMLPPNGFAVIYENQFTNEAFAAVPFSLSSKGDEVILSAATNNALTGYRRKVKFGAAQNSVSFGRYSTSDAREEFVAMSARTFGVDDPASVAEFRQGSGTNNPYPRVGPIVISEIMYHPPDIGTNDNTRDEFIELRNISAVAVPLYDQAAPTNTWHLRDAVDFDFPPGTMTAAGETLLVVSFDPFTNPTALAAFRATYHLATNVPIVGPYSGKLANDTDEIELRRPDAPNPGDVPYVLVEHVRYFDTAPWPAVADGSGWSLHRISDSGFGNDATNWFGAPPKPGQSANPQDSDGDGMPSAWEITYGLNPLNGTDANLDSDGDGLTNLQEFQLGSNPRDGQSGLRFSNVRLLSSVNAVMLRFTAVSNWTYTIQHRSGLGTNAWLKLTDVSAQTQTHEMEITDSMSASEQRFYRLVTPAITEP